MSAQQDNKKDTDVTFGKGKGKAQPQEDVKMSEDEDSSDEEESGVEDHVSCLPTLHLDHH